MLSNRECVVIALVNKLVNTAEQFVVVDGDLTELREFQQEVCQSMHVQGMTTAHNAVVAIVALQGRCIHLWHALDLQFVVVSNGVVDTDLF